MSREPCIRFAIIGDVHNFWDQADTDYFNASDSDYLLFVGDFPSIRRAFHDSRLLTALTKPAFAIPGNHDCVHVLHLFGEMEVQFFF